MTNTLEDVLKPLIEGTISLLESARKAEYVHSSETHLTIHNSDNIIAVLSRGLLSRLPSSQLWISVIKGRTIIPR